ncbi:MAG: 30S ribosomal protein S12 methylthiotransferase RimO [Candidatus Omnitrophica bacterium]|nr:30S ribosomal protein S12 methylthiotransferase RimO [Candidatus Omnitrophota bacterium]MDD5654306.1 30S ribosomal protein S12 methylthiotransferase RimO [Candidatus Omnitrophota bacterium]
MKSAGRKKKVGILSLGCPRNMVDSESILSRLKLKDYVITDMEDAEVGIVNTCAFIRAAKEESIDAILSLLELKKEGRLKKLIVCGCLPQRYKDELCGELREVDAFIGKPCLDQPQRHFFLTPRHYAYLKICEGCVNHCSFCVIPGIKGDFSSRDMGSLVKEARALDKKGVKELGIIGQDITLYGRDLSGKQSLVALVKDILKNTKGIRWVRLLYLYPSHITDELLDLIGREERICKYIDIPLQHINERILKTMNRRMSRDFIEKLIDKVRKKIPGVALRTSLMVGFPTETEEEFEELLEFVGRMEFERLGVFTYSREEGTGAYGLTPQVPDKIKNERFDKVMVKQQEISRRVNGRFLGKTVEVLVDEKGQGHYLGRSFADAPEVDGNVFINTSYKIKTGDFVKCRITDTLEYDLVGEPI